MKSPARSQALDREVRAFCERHSLTPRESEILGLLVEGVVRIKDVAARLGLSPNTVNNHVNSIFMKTHTRSKSQLLSDLLASVAEELQNLRAWRRRPRALVCGTDDVSRALISKELEARGFQLGVVSDLSALESAILDGQPDLVMVDVGASRDTVISVMDRTRSATPAPVVLIGDDSSPRARRLAMSAGACDWLSKPFSDAELASALVTNCIQDDVERTRRIESEVGDVKVVAQPMRLTSENLGYGGMVVGTDELERVLGARPSLGAWLDFKVSLDSGEESWPARGQVVWTGESGRSAGVRFTTLAPVARERMRVYLRQHAVKSYIPDRND